MRVNNIIYAALYCTCVLYMFMLGFLLLQQGRLMSVSDDNMNPSLSRGSMVLYKEIEPIKLQIEDIIAFERSYEPLQIGRVVGVIYTETGDLLFRTKPDAKTSIDFNFVKESEIRGKVTASLIGIGFIADLSQNFGGKLLLVLLLIVMLGTLCGLNRKAGKTIPSH